MGLVRFRSRACRFRANAPGSLPTVGATLAVARKPSPLGEGVTRSVTDEVRGQRPPAGRPVSGLYGKAGEFSVFRRGGWSSPARLEMFRFARRGPRPARKPSLLRGEGGTAKP